MRRLLAVLGVALVVLGVTYVARPAEHVPPYDANLVRLAESELEAYCAGLSFARAQSPGQAAVGAEECRKARSQDQVVQVRERVKVGPKYESFTSEETIRALSTVPDPGLVTIQFCQALDDSLLVAESLCVAIMEQNQYWPTYGGWLTSTWSEQWPYPNADTETWTGLA